MHDFSQPKNKFQLEKRNLDFTAGFDLIFLIFVAQPSEPQVQVRKSTTILMLFTDVS